MDHDDGREYEGVGDPDQGADALEATEVGTAEVGPSGDHVMDQIASIRTAVENLSRSRLWSRSDPESRDGVREGFAVLQSLESAWLGLVADLDTRPGAVPGARAGTVAQTFLRAGLLRTSGQAASDVRAAHALAREAVPSEGGMPSLGQAFAAGQVSREHVDAALRAVRKLPKRVLSEPVTTPDGPTPDSPTPDEGVPDGPAPDEGMPDEAAPDEAANEATDDSAADEGCPSEMTAGEAVDAFFAEHCRKVDPIRTGRLARHLLEALDPDGQDGFDPDASERRGLTHSTDSGGMVVGRFQLDPVTGSWFATAIEHFSAPEPTVEESAEDGSTIHVRDTRSAAQRRADALGLISRIALGADEAGTAKGGEPPRIVVHTGVQEMLDALRAAQRSDGCNGPSDIDQSDIDRSDAEQAFADAMNRDRERGGQPESEPDAEPDPAADPAAAAESVSRRNHGAGGGSDPGGSDSGGSNSGGSRSGVNSRSGKSFGIGRRGAQCEPLGPIGPRLLGRLACDSLMQKVLLSSGGAVLDLGRDTRTVSRAQRRALNARDRGCVIPGCSAPPQYCEAHHVVWWRNNGRTDIDNLALVCGRDHNLIHLGVWELTMINGVPWARPPSWLDPLRRLIRNTLHQRADQARNLGTQLHLVLPPDPSHTPPTWARAPEATPAPGGQPDQPTTARPVPKAPNQQPPNPGLKLPEPKPPDPDSWGPEPPEKEPGPEPSD